MSHEADQIVYYILPILFKTNLIFLNINGQLDDSNEKLSCIRSSISTNIKYPLTINMMYKTGTFFTLYEKSFEEEFRNYLQISKYEYHIKFLDKFECNKCNHQCVFLEFTQNTSKSCSECLLSYIKDVMTNRQMYFSSENFLNFECNYFLF